MALLSQFFLRLFRSRFVRLLSNLGLARFRCFEFRRGLIAFRNDFLNLLRRIRRCLLLRRLFVLLDFDLRLLSNLPLTRLGSPEFRGYLLALGDCPLNALLRFLSHSFLCKASLFLEFPLKALFELARDD